MKKTPIIIVVVILILVVALIILRSPEDDWIKDERGVWIKHGAPAETPESAKQQQEVIDAALNLYNGAKTQGTEFSSQCLGTFGDYAVDVVHVPRNEIDNLPENQCEDYRQGKVKHFIELNNIGDIVRIK